MGEQGNNAIHVPDSSPHNALVHNREFGTVPLSQYIQYHKSGSRPVFRPDENIGPAFAGKDSTVQEKSRSIFAFGQHIARELEVIHGQGMVHQHLKSSTGISRNFILYSWSSFLFNAGKGLENWAFV